MNLKHLLHILLNSTWAETIVTFLRSFLYIQSFVLYHAAIESKISEMDCQKIYQNFLSNAGENI